MISKRTCIIRLVVCLVPFVVFFVYTLSSGDNLSDDLGWLILFWLVMFAEWTLFAWLRERIGRHCYWVMVCFCALYYFIGGLIVDAIPGWSAIGALIVFLFSLAVLAVAVIFFLIEMLIYHFNKKK